MLTLAMICIKKTGILLTKRQFKESFLSKRLRGDTSKERIKLFRRLKMLRYEKDQDNVEPIDKERMKFKRGYYLGKPSSAYLKSVISVLVEATSLGLAVLLLISGLFIAT